MNRVLLRSDFGGIRRWTFPIWASLTLALSGCFVSVTGVSDEDGGAGRQDALAAPAPVADAGSDALGTGVDATLEDAIVVGSTMDSGTTWMLPDGWWNESWRRRYRVRVNTEGLSEGLTNVPILIELSPDRVDYDRAGARGAAIRFVQHGSGGAEELDHEIERWADGGSSVVWVRGPTVEVSEELTMYMYLDNPDAASRDGVGWVWDSEYRGVWHLTDGFGDSTDRGNDGSTSPAADVAGRIAGGKGLGDGTHSTIPDDGSLDLSDAVTISAWVRPDGDGHHRGVLSKRVGCEGEANYALFITSGGQVQFEFFAGGWRTWRAGRVPSGEWTHVAASYDGEERRVRIFVNGVGLLSEMTDHRLVVDANPIELGANGGCGGDYFEGGLDEVRLSGGARSEAWLWLQHRVVAERVTLFGPAEGEGL